MSLIFAVLLFSLLIFVHELGHFVTAKLSGVRVNEFSMFMGPAIFKKQVGETLYSIRCIPFGGYCAMEGEDSDSDDPRSFGSAAWWKRLIILLAGAAMNFLAGLLLLALVYAPVKDVIVPEIASMEQWSTIGGADGLQVGDRFLEVDGEKIYNQADFSMLLALNGGDVHDLVVERDGKRVELNDFFLERHEVTDKKGDTQRLLGISFGVEKATFGKKAEIVWNAAVDYVRMVRLSLQMLFTGQAGLQDMSGPVGIVQQITTTAEQSETRLIALLNMLNFGALIAVNLAVMNLLPIPALDGGRAVCVVLTAAAEKITGKKINGKYEAYLHGAGMIVLLIFMAVISFKDIFMIFKG